MSHNYQLTRHPVGSLREIIAVAWPLAVGFASTNLMIFVDRLLLAQYQAAALNAGANAGMVYYMFLIVPLSICAISEVFVGRLHGERSLAATGIPVWQMIRFACLCAPLFWAIAVWLPPLLFYGTGNQLHETAYFQPLMIFAPLSCISIAISGFFIGIGKTHVVTYSILTANCCNIVLACLFIFGAGPIPAMGTGGAGLAMGLAHLIQCCLLLATFLRKEYRSTYGTTSAAYNSSYFWESISIGVPVGLGHGIELLAHCIFFRFVMQAGQDYLTVVAAVQSLYIVAALVIEAESKSVTAIVANLIGAGQESLIARVFKSAVSLHSLLTIPLALTLFFFPDLFLNLFLGTVESELAWQMAYYALLWMTLFFLFDGFNWILVGHFTAAKDTKFLLYVSGFINSVGYVLPGFVLIGMGKGGGDLAWMIIAIYSMLTFTIYFSRYLSGVWLRKGLSQPLEAI